MLRGQKCLGDRSGLALLRGATDCWPLLTELVLTGCGFSGTIAIEAAVAAGCRLEKLVLSDMELSREAAEAMAGAGWDLRELDLSHNTFLEADELQPLLAARWPRLRVLLLKGNSELGDAGAAVLAQGDWPALERLEVDGSEMTPAGAAVLAAGRWPALRRLTVGTGSGPGGLWDVSVFQNGAWPLLEKATLIDEFDYDNSEYYTTRDSEA